MKKICMLCLTTFEDENLKYCPNCNFLPKSSRTLMDYDKYEAYLSELQNPNSTTRKQYDELMSQFSYNNSPSPELIEMLNSDSVEKKRFAEAILQGQSQNNASEQESNKPQCPTCHSYNVRPISGLNRAGSIFAWGLFSSKIGKTYECLNCKYKW